jgi:hypothetical protein
MIATLSPQSIENLQKTEDVLKVKSLAAAFSTTAKKLKSTGVQYTKLNLVYEFTEGGNVVYSIAPNENKTLKTYFIF